ncbi:hypothetical protein Ndes2526A_g05872 [Nannochloris sp. 'desiccata']
MDAREAKQRTWLLASQLSVSYGSSRSCRSTVSQLANLFPGLRHFSLAVLGNDGCMVTSTSKTEAGPRSVSLHLEGTSCIGIVASKGSALHASLAGPGGALLSKLSDIQDMLRATEDSSPISHIVCMPIQPSPSSSRRGVKGALLLGFSSPPEFTLRRKAGIAALCSMLSETLAMTAPAVICSVETMIGRHPGCPCCAPDSDDEVELENEDANAEPCHDNDKSSRRKDRGGPPQSLLIPIQEGEEEEGEGDGRRSGESSGNTTPRGKGGEKGDLVLSRTAPSISPAAAPSDAYIGNTRGGYTFSKPVAASITRESLRSRHPVTLSYTDSALETEFTYWFQDRLKPVDFLFSMLVVISMILLAYCRSGAAVSGGIASGSAADAGQQKAVSAVWSNFVSLPLLLPMLMASFCSSRCYQRRRESVIALVRIYLVLAASRYAISQLQAAQQQQHCGDGIATTSAIETTASFLACWIAAGGETLFTPAFGLQMRMKWHLPLQTAAVAFMCYNVQSICGPSFYQAVGILPQAGVINYISTVAAAAAVGLVLPTMMLRVSELKSRQQFEAQIGAAAGITAEI